MEKWILATELLEQPGVTEINLVAAVKAGELTAYDHTDKPINWFEKEETFTELQSKIVRKCCENRVEVVESTPFWEWDIVGFFLNNGVVKINSLQFRQFFAGWGDEQIAYYVRTAKFKEQDIDTLLSEKNHPHPTTNHHSQKSELTNLHIIGGLINILKGKINIESDYEASYPIRTEAKIIEILGSELEGYRGTSKRTLEDRFSSAKKALGED